MIGLVLVAHGALADEFLNAMQYVVGPQRQVATIGLLPTDDLAKRKDDILQAIHQVDTGSGVIILTDMFGGTPSNLAISVMDIANAEVIAGVNLPMLIKISALRENTSLKEVVAAAETAGKKYINVASKILGQ